MDGRKYTMWIYALSTHYILEMGPNVDKKIDKNNACGPC